MLVWGGEKREPFKLCSCVSLCDPDSSFHLQSRDGDLKPRNVAFQCPPPGSYGALSNMLRVEVQREDKSSAILQWRLASFVQGRVPLTIPFLALHFPLDILKWDKPGPGSCWFWEPLRSWISNAPLLGAQPICCAREMLSQISASWGGAATAGGRNRAGKGNKIPRAQASGTRNSGALTKSPPHARLSETS